jgi:hypothetical protein
MFFVTIILVWNSLAGQCQHLSFTKPVQFLKEAQTDKAASIINFNGDYFIAWKENSGKLSFSYLGKQYDTALAELIVKVPGAQTNFAPAFSSLNDKLYLFWISIEGDLHYITSGNDGQPNTKNIHRVSFETPARLSQGITSATVGDKILIATHAGNKEQVVYSILSPGENGVFKPSSFNTISNGRSRNYPFVVGLSDSSARFCWQGRDDLIYFSDLDVLNNTWTTTNLKGPAQTSISPAMFHVLDRDQLFYIWRGHKKDSRLYYKAAKEMEDPAGRTALPGYFASDYPVTVSNVDENNFLMTFTGQRWATLYQ